MFMKRRVEIRVIEAVSIDSRIGQSGDSLMGIIEA